MPLSPVSGRWLTVSVATNAVQDHNPQANGNQVSIKEHISNVDVIHAGCWECLDEAAPTARAAGARPNTDDVKRTVRDRH